MALQKVVKTFRMALDQSYSQFPPGFLITHYVPQKFSLHDKIKYVDLVLKYSKQATSAIDVGTVRYEVLRELRKRNEELSKHTCIDCSRE